MYYYLVDVNFTPIEISRIDIRLINSPSLVVHWVYTEELHAGLRRYSFVVLDSKGNIIKCCWPSVDSVSDYVMDLIATISTDASDWNIKKYSYYKRKINEVYSGLWKSKVRMLPRINSLLGNIVRR